MPALGPEETERLIHAVLAGERPAFDDLVRAHLRLAYTIALAVVRRPADAEDIAQVAMITAFEKLESCREPRRFRAWLAQIVRNRALNWLEARRLRDVCVRPSSDGEETGMGTGSFDPSDALTRDRHALLTALGALSPVRREIVLLHDLEDWTHAEIADSLGISETMSRQHLFQARRELRARLEPLSPQEGETCKERASI